jgi:hypothetical protein
MSENPPPYMNQEKGFAPQEHYQQQQQQPQYPQQQQPQYSQQQYRPQQQYPPQQQQQYPQPSKISHKKMINMKNDHLYSRIILQESN